MALVTEVRAPDAEEVTPLLRNSQDDHQSFGSISTATVTPVDAALDESGLIPAKGSDDDDEASLEEGDTERGPVQGGGRSVVKIISVLLIGRLSLPLTKMNLQLNLGDRNLCCPYGWFYSACNSLNNCIRI